MIFLRLSLILAALVLTASSAWAQENFLGQCHSQDMLTEVRQTEFKWLKQIFKTLHTKFLIAADARL